MKRNLWLNGLVCMVCMLCMVCLRVNAQAAGHHGATAHCSATQSLSHGAVLKDEVWESGWGDRILASLSAAEGAWGEGASAYDWHAFAGAHYTPQAIAGQFGAPDEIEGLLYDPGEDGAGEPVYDVAEGAQYAVYHYQDFSVHLFVNPQDDQWTVEALEIRNPLAPVTIEGVSVGMEWREAVSALQDGGYAQNMDIWNGSANLYFEKYDAQGCLCMVEIRLDGNGTIAYARGLWGAVAEMERADYLA